MKLFKGNMGRLNYFGQSIALVVVCLILYVVAGGIIFIGMADSQSANAGLFSKDIGLGALAIALIFVTTTLYALAISARRLRNIGHSPWWCLALIVPYVGFAAWLYLCLRPGQQVRIVST